MNSASKVNCNHNNLEHINKDKIAAAAAAVVVEK